MASELDYERARLNSGVYIDHVCVNPHTVAVAETLDGRDCVAELRVMIGSAVLMKEFELVMGTPCDDLAASVRENLHKHGTLAASGYLDLASQAQRQFRKEEPVTVAWEWARVDAVVEEHETLIITGGARKVGLPA